MAEDAQVSPDSQGPAIPLFDGTVRFVKLRGQGGTPIMGITFECLGHLHTYAMEYGEARKVCEALGTALQSEHIDIASNGNGRLWRPPGP